METKIFLIPFMIVSLVFVPFAGFGQESVSVPPPQSVKEQADSNMPPVEQPLVPEGVFAVQLAQALKMGEIKDEAQAENILSAVGIEPKNGWIADYPVTPDIIAEIKQSVAAAADANKIGMGKDEAQKVVAGLEASLGLDIQSGSPPGGLQPTAPPAEVVNNYYYDYGPPVVTYYPPPWDYDYLYAWVPYPFFCGGFFFGGFFVLHDFHRDIHFHHHEFVVTNHVVNPTTNRVFVVDPVSRSVTTNRVAFSGAFRSPKIQTSAGAIVSRNWSKVTTGGVPSESRMGSVPSPSLNRGGEQIRRNEGTIEKREPQPMNHFQPPQVARGRTFSPPPVSEKTFRETPPRFSSPPSVSQGHTFSSHTFDGSRGFSGAFHGGGGSFSRGFHSGGGGHR